MTLKTVPTLAHIDFSPYYFISLCLMKKHGDLFIGISLTFLLLSFYLFDFHSLKILELKTYDLRTHLAMHGVPPPEVVIVAIDNESISRIGRWPWPRNIIAELIKKISAARPNLIGLNILFSEAEKNPGLDEIRQLKTKFESDFGAKRKIDKNTMQRWADEFSAIEQRLDNDSKLIAAVSVTDNIILPLYFNLGAGGPMADEETMLKLSPSAMESPSNVMIEASGLTPPIPQLISDKMKVGHVNIYPDPDGTIRGEMLFIDFQGKLYPSFALQLALRFLNISPETLSLTPSELRMGKRGSIPYDERGFMLLSFWGGYRTFPYFSAHEVMEEKISPDTFKDKIVLIGNTASGIADFNVVPVAAAMPGIEIIANAVGDIIHGKSIKRPNWAFLFEFAGIFIFGLYISLVLPKLKAKWGAMVSFLILLTIIVAGVYFFNSQGLWLKISYPSFLILFGYILITSKKFLITERKKELVEADSIETNKMLGLSFQGQGMLDMAFEKFRKCPLDDAVKDLLYNLSLDFERKRQFNKAAAVLQHIEKADKNFKDIENKIKSLKEAAEGKVTGLGATKKPEGTVIMPGASQTPTLGRYEVIKELGKGAMGIVYLGKDPKINRTVAIKTLQFDTDLDETQLKLVKERFFREAESAGMLNHPNIITIFDAGEDYDISYIAMELLDGDDLKKNCDKKNLLSVRNAVEIMAKVASALDYAHKQGVIHRDIKPANIMILKDGTVKVTDFGIARISSSSKTATGTVLGTPSYMSPEQIAGKKVDGRSDIFSLGATFYELLTGEKPFQGESIAQLLFQITQEKQPDPRNYRPELTESLILILDKMLEKDVAKRYQTAFEVENALRKCL